MELTITDEQILEALEENGHEDIAEALAEKVKGEPKGERPPREPTMNELIRGQRAA